MLENTPELRRILVMAVAFLIALTVHEYAHARAALAAGDDTAKLAGRVTLNPLAHLDPLGTVFLVFMIIRGVGIGWGKPVPVNPLRFKSPRWDNLKVSLWGPASNILLAVAFAIVRVPILHAAPEYRLFVETCIQLNLALAFFNLIPVGPLDGSHILASLLPADAAYRYERLMHTYGILILFALLLTGALSLFVWPPMAFFYGLLTGW